MNGLVTISNMGISWYAIQLLIIVGYIMIYIHTSITLHYITFAFAFAFTFTFTLHYITFTYVYIYMCVCMYLCSLYIYIHTYLWIYMYICTERERGERRKQSHRDHLASVDAHGSKVLSPCRAVLGGPGTWSLGWSQYVSVPPVLVDSHWRRWQPKQLVDILKHQGVCILRSMH
jgi:membrane-bound ClpP family serine protease